MVNLHLTSYQSLIYIIHTVVCARKDTRACTGVIRRKTTNKKCFLFCSSFARYFRFVPFEMERIESAESIDSLEHIRTPSSSPFATGKRLSLPPLNQRNHSNNSPRRKRTISREYATSDASTVSEHSGYVGSSSSDSSDLSVVGAGESKD